MLLLHGHELIEGEGLVHGERDELQPTHRIQVAQKPVLDDVLDLGHQVVEAHQLSVECVQVRLDVHRGPCEAEHARLDDALQLGEVRLEQRLGDGHDALHHALVLRDRVREEIEVELKLFLLRQHHLGALRHLLPHPHQALGFAQQLQDLAVKVDVQASGVRVPHQERRLQARLGRLDALGPRQVPKRLEFDDGAGNLVVHLDELLRLLGGHQRGVLLELLHRPLDATHQLAGPHHVARDGRRVAHRRRRHLLLLVQALHCLEVNAVVLKDDQELGLEIVLERLALQRRLELAEEHEGVLGGGDVLEGLVDEALKRRLELVDVGVELEVIAVKLVHLKVEQVVRLALEVGDEREEARHQPLEPFELLVGECRELLDRAEHVDELLHAAAEEVELAKDGILIEVKLLAARVLGERIAHGAVLLLVLAVAVDAAAQPRNQRQGGLLPEGATPGLHERAAIGDHLLGHLAEERRHPLSAVVARNRVHHLDVVEQPRQRLDHRRGRAIVERVDVLVKGVKVLDVVLGLVGRVGDCVVVHLPPLERTRLCDLQHREHHAAPLAVELLNHRVELGHAAAPVVELSARPAVAVGGGVLLLAEQPLRLLAPLEHRVLVLLCHGRVGRRRADGSSAVRRQCINRGELEPARERLDCLAKHLHAARVAILQLSQLRRFHPFGEPKGVCRDRRTKDLRDHPRHCHQR
mmetsp:Transcript_32173/g.96037  ORF Transcript_32173/g.96037 Transcript_32173/m.96037 type:complete len:696 (-) Transcript_32173:372-2459(-)